MLTTKKRTQFFVIFLLGLMMMGGWTGCAPAGARALLKGERLIKEGKYAEAVKSFEKVTAALPENAKAWNHLGLGYQYAGEPKKAEHAYQTALKLDRNFAEARYNLGSLYLDQNNLAAAIIDLTTYTQFNPKNPDGWLKLGLAQKRLGSASVGAEKNRQLDAAKRNIETAQKLRPSAEALNAIGLIQVQRGQPREAIPKFTAALQLQPNFSDALLNLAVVYHQHLNDRRLALVNYRQFLAVAKQAPETTQVQMIVRQLEGELNPPAPVSPKPQTAVASNTSAVVASVPPLKIETNCPKPVITAKPPVAFSSPKAQPLPVVPKKDVLVEITKLPDEVPIKSALEIQEMNVGKPIATVSNNSTVTTPTNPVRQASEPQKGSGVIRRLNP
ncbi:MAG: tetratricopeptide repeat protein, partial [Verrucomicrobiota bacterium]